MAENRTEILISVLFSRLQACCYSWYAGQYRDEESELMYMRARYYDPETQQFISRDPSVWVTGQPYSYAGGNPVNATDPTGHFPWLLVGAIALGIGANVAFDVGVDFVFNNATFDFWSSVGGSLSNPLTYLGSIPGGQIVKLGKVGKVGRAISHVEEFLLDTNTVISHGKHYVASGHNVVKSVATDAELRYLVRTRGGRISMPHAANQIPSVGLPNIDTRILIRGYLRPGRKGNFVDGIIGATAIERNATLITNDADLLRAVIAAGGKARLP